MKKQLFRTAILGIITLFSYTFVSAQMNSPIVANVPFDFSVGDKKMPAGEYVVEFVSPFSDSSALLLRQRNGKAQMLIRTLPAAARKKGEAALLFNRYGDVNYLAEIHNPFAEFGARLRQNKTEINLARQFTHSRREIVRLNSPKKPKT